MSNSLLPAELQNNPASIDTEKDAKLPQQVVNAPDFKESLNSALNDDEPLDDLLMDESLTALGGEMKIGEITFPPPTAGVLMLLETIGSPFVAADPPDEITLDEIIQTLFIIINREASVQLVTNHSKAQKIAKLAFTQTEKSPEHLEVYLAFLERMSEYNEFETEVANFAIELGPLDPVDASAKIARYMQLSMGGYNLIPKGDGNNKKKDSSTPNG